MKLTCSQMDVLISFYIEGDLSSALKTQVEDHLKDCSSCRTKFEIIKTMISDLKNNLEINENFSKFKTSTNHTLLKDSKQYNFFKENLSSYLDNELSSEDNIKIKKFTINNLQARKDLEDSYNIRKLMNESFKKAQQDSKQDYSKNILKQLEIEDTVTDIHPAIKLIVAFSILVLTTTALILMTLSV